MPNSDFANFQYKTVHDEGTVSTDMYTQKRVNQFVSDYSNYKKTEVKGTPADPNLYVYYHFTASPQAITTTNLGTIASSLCLIDNSQNCLLQVYKSSSGAPFKNTPDGHKLNLLKDYELYLKTISSQFQIFQFKDDTLDISDNIMTNLQPSNLQALDQFIDTNFATNKSSLPFKSRSYGIEIFAYIQFPAFGDYKFSFNLDVSAPLSTFIAWIGDVAICEYMIGNSTMDYNKRKDVTVSVVHSRKVPIRLQYYCTPPTSELKRKSQLDLLKMLTMKHSSTENLVAIDLYSSSSSQSDFIYPPLYAAFTSETENTYTTGQFLCYTNFDLLKLGNRDKSNQFYNVIKRNRRDMKRGVYDRDKDGTKEVGKLPSPLSVTDSLIKEYKYNQDLTSIYFTQNNLTNPLQLPNVFSIYRFSIDGRYDNTYQISTKPVSPYQSYPMNQVDNRLLKFSNSYTDFTGYFPLNTRNILDLSTNHCKERCNNSPSDCGYYYTYTSNGKPKCVLDDTGNLPLFNQVRSSTNMDVESGVLSLRNKQIKDANKLKCAESEKIEPIVATTDDYTRNFKYANYDLSPTILDDSKNLGTCGSSRYKSFVDRAKDILYQTHEYRSDGQWKPDSNQDLWIAREGLESINSTAVNDTTDSIQSNLVNHDRLRQKLIGINKRDEELVHSMQAYHGLSKFMNSEDRYDHKGNKLLYLRSDPPPPSLSQMNANDSQFLSNQQTLVFYTGIITAATLIVLAVTMGGE